MDLEDTTKYENFVDIDTISAPEYDQTIAPQHVGYNQEESYQYVEEPHYQPIETTEHQVYQESPAQPKKSRSDFLLKKAFAKVASLFDSLFYKG